MKLTHKELTPKLLDYDKRVFAPGLPDMGLSTKQENSYYTIVVTLKNKSLPIAKLGIGWVYTITHLGREILKIVGEDEYSADTSDLSNQDEEIDKMVKESRKRFSEAFDDVRPSLGIGDSMLNMSQSELNQIRFDLIKDLKEKLF